MLSLPIKLGGGKFQIYIRVNVPPAYIAFIYNRFEVLKVWKQFAAL